jgi:hypothetical protein
MLKIIPLHAFETNYIWCLSNAIFITHHHLEPYAAMELATPVEVFRELREWKNGYINA